MDRVGLPPTIVKAMMVVKTIHFFLTILLIQPSKYGDWSVGTAKEKRGSDRASLV